MTINEIKSELSLLEVFRESKEPYYECFRKRIKILEGITTLNPEPLKYCLLTDIGNFMADDCSGIGGHIGGGRTARR